MVLLLEDKFMTEDQFSRAALICTCSQVDNIIPFVMITNEMHATNGKLILQTGFAHLLVKLWGGIVSQNPRALMTLKIKKQKWREVSGDECLSKPSPLRAVSLFQATRPNLTSRKEFVAKAVFARAGTSAP